MKSQIHSLAVESTFNWYWLVDGLRSAGYPVDLANPARIEPYSGLKHADDKDDAGRDSRGGCPTPEWGVPVWHWVC